MTEHKSTTKRTANKMSKKAWLQWLNPFFSVEYETQVELRVDVRFFLQEEAFEGDVLLARFLQEHSRANAVDSCSRLSFLFLLHGRKWPFRTTTNSCPTNLLTTSQ